MNRKALPIVMLFAVVLFGFVWGLYRVFLLPLETGTAYSPYSSYRADPLGTSAYYEALRAHPGLVVSRNERNLLGIGSGQGKTLFFNGVYDSPDPKPVLDALENFVDTGGRLVLAFSPEDGFEDWLEEMPSEHEGKGEEASEHEHEHENKGKGEAEGEGETEEEEDTDMAFVTERWGFELKQHPRKEDETAFMGYAERAVDDEALPDSVPWRSRQYCSELDPAWKAIYTCLEEPVLIERSLGKGSIVVSTDSYLLSNEAMVQDRFPGLLSWFPGANATIIFDELHNGISRDPGVVRLMREYRLTPLLVSLALLALLFIWQSAMSLLPKRSSAAPETSGVEEGQSVTAGLNNLLRRSIPRAEVLRACLDAWKQDCARRNPGAAQLQGRAEAVLDSTQPGQTLPEHYNRIAAILQERTRP